MSIEALSAMASAGAKAAGNGVRLNDLAAHGNHAPHAGTAAEVRFQASIGKAVNTPALAPTSAISQAAAIRDMPPAVQGMFKALDGINGQAKSVSEFARTAEASGGQLTPGEIVQLTMKCQEFMFQCQLTSNIANRSSDGIQQLFKQQG